MVNKAPQP